MATAAEGAGATVVLYDVDASTLGPDLESLSSLRALHPAAVVVGHLFGHVVDVIGVSGVTGDAMLIEDAAQGAGGRLRGKPLGSFGSLSVLSFGRGKGMTGGGGGALLAHDDRGAAALGWARAHHPVAAGSKGLRGVGALAAQMVLGRPSLYALPAALPFLHLGETRYHPPRPPRPLAPASMAVLNRVLPHVDDRATTWARNATRLLGALRRSPRLRPPVPVEAGDPGFLRLPAVLTAGGPWEAAQGRAQRLGVTRGYPTTLAALPSLGPRLMGAVPLLPGATRLAESLVTLPTHGLLAEGDLAALERWILSD
jgi:dTDP-4-amino-4,6-dideoxygalactose transaminase